MKSIILFCILISFIFADTLVNIDSNHSNITDFELEYFIDGSKRSQFDDIKHMKFKVGKNKDTLGAEVTNTWVKIKLFNSTPYKQTLFIHQDLAYTFVNIDYYEVNSSRKLLNKKKINVYDSTFTNNLNGADSIYKFTLNANEIKTIYVHQTTLAYHFYNFSIMSEEKSSQYLVFEKIDGILFVGLLFALFLYNLFIYISSRYKEYLYYSLYLLSATIWIFYMYGALAHYFYMYGQITFRFNFGLIFIPFFLAFFVQTIFETKTLYKTEHKFLNIMIILLFINFIYAVIDFNHALKILSLVLNYTLITFLWISISIYRKGNSIIKIFLYAHTFYLIFNIYALLFYLGLIDYSYIALHGIGIGIIIEALMLSYLVSYKFKIIEAEKEEQRLSKVEAEKEQAKSELLLFQKSKMADMGEMIASIAHQWRQPLAIINVSSGILREKKNLNRLSDKDFEEELTHIDQNILHMSETVNDFLTYFRPNKTKEHFYISEAVEKSLVIIGNTIYKEEIVLDIDVNKTYQVYGFKEEYMQVIICIVSNAIYALKKTKGKQIFIATLKYADEVSLTISDNGGGINNQIINKIFEPYFTTKNKSVGTGLGLYIAKNIIETNMNGSLQVTNCDDGAKFSIKI